MQKIIASINKKEQVTFTIVQVKNQDPHTNSQKTSLLNEICQYFPNTHIILMWKGNSGIQYYGRKDITNYLRRVDINSIKWKEYTFN
jgi:hypothetical protein